MRSTIQLSCIESLRSRSRQAPNYFKCVLKTKRHYRKKKSSQKSSGLQKELPKITINLLQPTANVIKNFNYSTQKYFVFDIQDAATANSDAATIDQEKSIDEELFDIVDFNLVNTMLIDDFSINAIDIIGSDIFF